MRRLAEASRERSFSHQSERRSSVVPLEDAAVTALYRLVQENKESVFPTSLFGNLVALLEEMIERGELTPVLRFNSAKSKVATRSSFLKQSSLAPAPSYSRTFSCIHTG